MKITTGLFDHIVLQRDAQNFSDALITGTCTTDGPVQARVLQDGTPVNGLNGQVIGQVKDDAFEARLCGLPAGGPYEVELTIGSDRLTVHDVLVGDVWVLAGQSNMQGCGANADRAEPHPLVRAFYMDDRWAVAEDPIHNMDQCVDQVHIDLCGGMRPAPATTRGVGPGVAFGREMLALTGVPQGVLACAHGGTSMAQWDPKLKRHGGRSLYGATIRRFKKNGGNIAGVVWYQGCSDAFPETAAVYTPRMQALVRSLRRDFGDANLPFVAVQISRVYGGTDIFPSWNDIQEQQRRLPETIRGCAVVPAIDLDMDDSIHLSGKSQNRLGRRLASAMQVLRLGTGKPSITLKKISVKSNQMNGWTDIIVEFANVEGKLQALGNPSGFDVIDGSGANGLYRIDLDGNRAILHTAWSPLEVEEKSLCYGAGLWPYCNITDGADRSLPVFGPIRIRQPRAVTGFVRRLQVSDCQPATGSIKALAYPADQRSLNFHTCDFSADFCDLHATLATAGDAVVYYLCHIDCSEPMQLNALVGYDGPVKVWIDGVQQFCDPNGNNPAIRDSAKLHFAADAGRHEILIALDSHQGRAWGVFLRFERTDVPQRLVKRGPDFYSMPLVMEEEKELVEA
ncbi:MAG: sialate O-acetylesterase [Armatimonadota bacterium]